MDFHLHLLGGSFSFCIKLLCPILLNESGLKLIIFQSFGHYSLAPKSDFLFFFLCPKWFNSSRIVARSIALNESQFGDPPENDNSSSGIAQSTTHSDASSTLSVSALSRSRGRVHALWQWVLQKWPSVRKFSSCYVQSVFYHTHWETFNIMFSFLILLCCLLSIRRCCRLLKILYSWLSEQT